MVTSKRIIDISVSSVLLVLTAVPVAILALIIKLDGGSGFYRSRRIGLGGHQFDAYKLRTMVPGAEHALTDMLEKDATIAKEWRENYKLSSDSRVTSLGKILRMTSIDELPQLVNVLKGEMSLVGPRPILPEEVQSYHQASLDLYCKCTPGLTGLWQVNGRSDNSFNHKVALNNQYIKNWSTALDMKILGQTVVVVFRRIGAR